MARASDPILARKAAKEIVRMLRDAGHPAYFAGGCVRDELLGLNPTDYDVATGAPPAEVKRIFGRVHEVGEHFGVILVPRGDVVVEVATFRADGSYSDGRRPDSVKFAGADAQTDAKRRDFTINALMLDPQDGTGDQAPLGGKVLDYVGGMDDLHAGVIRAVGDAEARLGEDHLRALRAVRFAARLGFLIDEGTQDAITRQAAELKGVSRERIGEELRRMLLHRRRAEALALIQKLRLDAPVLNESHRDVELTTVKGLPANADVPTSLTAWALDRHGDMGVGTEGGVGELVSRWRAALCLTNEERDALNGALVCAHQFPKFEGMGVAAAKRLASRAGFEAAMACEKVRRHRLAETVIVRVMKLAGDGVGLDPRPVVDGEALIGLGMKPGPRFKGVLEQVYDAQLEGRVRNLEEGLELARKLSV